MMVSRADIELRLRNSAASRDPVGDALQRLSGDIAGKLSVPADQIKHAAVLIPIVEHANAMTVLLTRRTEHLPDHPGQISFPGGRIDPGDKDEVAAALRETSEETGIEAERIETVGYLSPYLTVSGYVVTPIVGFVKPGFTAVPEPFEVAEVFEVPLSFVMNPANHRKEHTNVKGRAVEFHVLQFNHYRIWGATAAMLVDFYRLLTDEKRQAS